MKKIILFSMLLFVAHFHAQTLNATTTENYIYSKTCLDADCIKKIETVQYFDGLGTPKQIINIKATPLGKDVVGHFEYDQFGRQVNDYLPIPQSGTQNGAIYTSPLNNAPSIYGSEKIYSEKTLEKSPLGRANQISPLGNDWSQHPVTFKYSANGSGEVKKYVVTTSWLDGRTHSAITLSSPYPVNQLVKTSATDSDGNITTEFQNGEGQIILVRKNDGIQDVDTYYLYNEYGQLAVVIPPLAVNAALDETTLNNLCYQYCYDGMGKLVEKKLPGKGWEYLIYDQQDRVIMTQDANLRTSENTFGAIGWMFTKYDKFGRVVYSGFYPSTDSRSTLQNTINNLTGNTGNNEVRSPSAFIADGIEVYYTQDAFPSGNMMVLAVNYYDSYPSYSFNPSFPASVFGQETITDSQNALVNTKTLPTLSLVRNIEDSGWTKNYVYYDKKGRVIAAHSFNYLGGYTKSETELDFTGMIKQSKVYHKRLNSDTEKIITQTFEYDSQNRLKLHKHKVEGNLQEEILAENEYNELSQLSNKKVGNNLQSIDYFYNIRGALTQVNDPSNLGIKLFGYKLKYFNPQNTTNATGKYNGNITEVDWKTATDNTLRRYNYQYDGLNRLKKGVYSEPDASVPQNDFYNETVGYDLNGNISSLQRNSKGASGMAEQIDNLTYSYTGNQLQTVVDGSGNYGGYPDTSGTAIPYDANGNMTGHEDKGLVNIKYNHLNLPSEIKYNSTYNIRNFETGEFEIRNVRTNYTYRADGTKLRKKYTNFFIKNSTERTTTTDYIDGFQYTVNYLGAVSLDFVPTSEGYYDFKNNKYIYSYTDHLGNVRLSYSRNATNGSAEVLQENNYYAFGLKHQGYNELTGNPSYKYQYNGKELQEETGWNDYGARMYMSDIGRWGVVDPLAEQYRRFSPYNYAANNPIRFIDPDGKRIATPAEGYQNNVPEGSLWYSTPTSLISKDSQAGGGGSTIGMFQAGSIGEPITYEQALAFLGINPGGVDFSKFDFSQYTTNNNDPLKPLIGGSYNGKSFNNITENFSKPYQQNKKDVRKYSLSHSKTLDFFDKKIDDLKSEGDSYSQVGNISLYGGLIGFVSKFFSTSAGVALSIRADVEGKTINGWIDSFENIKKNYERLHSMSPKNQQGMYIIKSSFSQATQFGVIGNVQYDFYDRFSNKYIGYVNMPR